MRLAVARHRFDAALDLLTTRSTVATPEPPRLPVTDSTKERGDIARVSGDIGQPLMRASSAMSDESNLQPAKGVHRCKGNAGRVARERRKSNDPTLQLLGIVRHSVPRCRGM